MNSFQTSNLIGGASSPVQRPGIRSETLVAAGIRNVTSSEALTLVGFPNEGIIIPYQNIDGQPLMVNGRPFHRIRLNGVTSGARYLAPKDSGCQLYLPPGVTRLMATNPDTLIVVEGEFKALALVEEGVPAVGVGGINSICPRDSITDRAVLIPALAELLKRYPVKQLAFAGDNDTALIPGFAQEAVKLAQLAGIPVVLPRIPFDAPGKAADDLKEVWGAQFLERWKKIMDGAGVVSPDTNPAQLALRLLRGEEKAIRTLLSLSPEKRDAIQTRCVKLVAAFKSSSPIAADDLSRICCSLVGARQNAFVKEVNETRKRSAEEMVAGRAQDLHRIIAPGGEPVLVFDGKNYWRRDLFRWNPICREDARLHLSASLGLSSMIRGDGPSEVDQALFAIQNDFLCDFAGPLCGRPAGLTIESGLRILVTVGPSSITTVSGHAPTVTELLCNLFGKHLSDPYWNTQFYIFCWWLKIAREALRNPSRHIPGHVLGLVGPRDCGKSFVQHSIITPALGGRSANPMGWLLGRTSFNEEIWAVEHLALGDESLGDTGPERKRLREELKKMVASPDYWRHPKHKNGIQMRPIWRCSISANDDAESICSLPTLEGSFEDKILYLKCHCPPQPFYDAAQSTARAAFSSAIERELPAFLDFVDRLEIPAEWGHSRFGIRMWHHPSIVELLRQSSPLAPLEESLDLWRSAKNVTERSITAVELHQEMAAILPAAIRSVAATPAWLGRLLARLMEEPEWRDRLSRTSCRVGPNNRRQVLWVFRFPGDRQMKHI